LLNGDYRAQAGDLINIRALQVTDKLTGISRKCFHITPLPLCIYGVKGERRFTRPAQAGEHHKLVPWNAQVNILQVVDPGPQHFKFVIVTT